MVVAVSYGEASVEILFMLWVGDQNLGWCTFLFGHDQARALRLFSCETTSLEESEGAKFCANRLWFMHF